MDTTTKMGEWMTVEQAREVRAAIVATGIVGEMSVRMHGCGPLVPNGTAQGTYARWTVEIVISNDRTGTVTVCTRRTPFTAKDNAGKFARAAVKKAKEAAQAARNRMRAAYAVDSE